MDKILTSDEITQFKNDGAIFLKDVFDIDWINNYINVLKDNKIPVSVRRSRGKDIQAACGQLANKH